MLERRVERWMSHDVITLAPRATIRDALDLMDRERIRHILIVDDRERLVGIVSSRDVKRVLVDRKAAGTIEGALDRPLSSIMTRNVVHLESDATLVEAAELMCREKISALPIVDEDNLAGIITSEDLLWAFVELDRDEEEEREDEEIDRSVPPDREAA